MKTLLVALTVSALVAVAGVGVVEACGAKFLVATKTARFQKLKRAAKTGRILVYQHSDDPGDTPEIVAEATANLRGMLESVGHDVVVARDENALRDLSRGDDIDVVMLSLVTARRLKGDIGSWAPGTHILPITGNPTRAQKASIKGEFGEVAVTGEGPRSILSSVENSL